MPADIVFSGINNEFIELAFLDADITSFTPTQFETLDLISGYTATVTGVGFQVPPGAEDPIGTVTGIAIRDELSNPVVTITGISWDATAFIAALGDEFDNDGDGGLLAALLNLQPIDVDASGSNIGALFWFEDVASAAITILGSANADTLGGGGGNDSINPGGVPSFEGDLAYGSGGNDTINLASVPSDGFFMLDYDDVGSAVTVNVNGTTNTMTVGKGLLGTDTVVSVNNALQGDGLNVWGGNQNDVFNLTAGSDAFLQAWGMRGNDTFNLTLSDDSTTRLSYTGNFFEGPTQGVSADLSTGTVSNDGFGGTDTINILGGTGRFEIRGNDNNDSIMGSDRNERFILEQGNDTLDAGDGYDVLRYDRSGVSSITVNLPGGQVTGQWDGNSFTHNISNVDEIRGSRDEGDNMIGDGQDNVFSGNGGDDSLSGGAGNDTLRGDTGNDSLEGGDDNDRLEGADNDDTLNGGGGQDTLDGGSGNDSLDPGSNTSFDVVDAGAGIDMVNAASIGAGYLVVGHYGLNNAGVGQTITISASGSSTIDKGINGTTTIESASTAMLADGLAVSGSGSDDTFNLDVTDGGWLQVQGGRGDDTFNLSASTGTVVLQFDSDNGQDTATDGVVVDLGTGTVSNDGFGDTDTITGVGLTETVIVRGSVNDDNLTGSSGRDRFDMRDGGDDTVDGAGGDIDQIRYHRFGAAVEVDLWAGTATAEGPEAFSHVLSNIEWIDGSEFGDRLLGAAGDNQIRGRDGDDAIFGDGFDIGAVRDVSSQVYRLYEALLDRTADYAGHKDWTQQIVTGDRTLAEVASGFVNSTEFQTVYGGVTNTEFVTLLFQNVLDRDPGPGAVNFINALNSGAQTREDVALSFSETAEFVNSTAAAVRGFIDARSISAWVDDVYRLFQATLDREPNETGLMNWTANLGNGLSFQAAVTGFVNSAEFQLLYGALSDGDFVTLLYDNVLDRLPSAGELQGWLDDIAGGTSREEVVTGFAQSTEFQNATADALESFVRGLGVHDELDGGSGSNTLIGGILSDQFIFDQSDGGTNTVMDLEAWDTLVFQGFGFADEAAARAEMAQVDEDVVFAHQGATVTIENILLADISDAMILV